MRVLATGQPGDDRPAANGAPANGTLRFSAIKGQWHRIALKYRGAGKECIAPRSKERQMYYTLADGRPAYFPFAVGEAIHSLSLAPGQDFWIRHDGGEAWAIERNDPTAPPSTSLAPRFEEISRERGLSVAPAEAAARVPAPAAARSVTSAAETPRREDSLQASAAAPAGKVNGQGEDIAAIRRRCLRAAVDAAMDAAEYAKEKYGLMLAPNFGDIRAIATSMSISEEGGHR